MSNVDIDNMGKCYPSMRGNDQIVRVLEGFTLHIPTGQFWTFLGPNGCGKTTFLRILAGLDSNDEGAVRIAGKPPRDAQIAYIFQNYAEALYPWKNVLDNIALQLEFGHIPRRERRQQAAELLKHLGLDIPHGVFPYELSGGQQQMVNIARGLMIDPDVLLMDEPFGSLDPDIRIKLQEEFLQLWRSKDKKSTVLFVSHELDEAVYLADQIVILGQKPSRPVSVIKVDLPRPRLRSILQEDAFFRIKRSVQAAFNTAIDLETSSGRHHNDSSGRNINVCKNTK